ncbi:MAG: hypothetical protein NZ954_03880 [Thermofilaceae archaeon]|nr:hypothetical protein [Thermofilaceae archaeon]MCX8181288.1 hypothetical protein [Thermofilaceae archaeon]MDW8004631.1 hypothetical protein [Thermofilaceae archaeon]
MDEYEELLKELEELVKSKQTLTIDELLKWGEDKRIGLVTLSLLIEELQRRSFIEAASEVEVVDEHLDIIIPKRIYVRKISATVHHSKVTKRKTPHFSKDQHGALLKFLYEEEQKTTEVKEEEKEKPRKELNTAGELSEPESSILERESPSTQTLLSLDKEFLLALQYLRRYWSVGELRFKSDMKSLGVKDPDSLLRRLSSEGLVKILEPGIVNADRESIEKIIQKSASILPQKSLADVLGL